MTSSSDPTPNTPQELLGRISDTSIYSLLPDFDEYTDQMQRLIRHIHGELVQGDLSYRSLQAMLYTTLAVWARLNEIAMNDVMRHYQHDFEIYTTIMRHHAVMDQYIMSMQRLITTMPKHYDDDFDPKYSQTVGGHL